jgi:hypothetical protein
MVGTATIDAVVNCKPYPHGSRDAQRAVALKQGYATLGEYERVGRFRRQTHPENQALRWFIMNATSGSGYSMTQLARDIDVKPPTLSKWAQGYSKPEEDYFSRFLKGVGISHRCYDGLANEIAQVSLPNSNLTNQTISGLYEKVKDL